MTKSEHRASEQDLKLDENQLVSYFSTIGCTVTKTGYKSLLISKDNIPFDFEIFPQTGEVYYMVPIGRRKVESATEAIQYITDFMMLSSEEEQNG